MTSLFIAVAVGFLVGVVCTLSLDKDIFANWEDE